MDDNGSPNNIRNTKLIRKEIEYRPAIVGEEHRKIPRMVAVGLVSWIPMSAHVGKGILRVAHLTVAPFVNVKTMGSYWRSPRLRRLIRRKPIHVHVNPSPARRIHKGDIPLNLPGQRPTPNPCKGVR
jgi:hypothetical protein